MKRDKTMEKDVEYSIVIKPVKLIETNNKKSKLKVGNDIL